MIKTLLAANKAERDHFTIPRSVQQSIPIRRIYRDGLWLVGRKLSRTWRFADVNYKAASEDDRRAIFLSYCGVLNSLPTDASAKVTICNRRLDPEVFRRTVLMGERGDRLDLYRREFNKILLDGKKSIAEDIVYSALDMVKEKTDQEPVAVLKRALDNIRPSLEVRSRRVGGATYQVPVEVKPARANTLSLRWLTDFSRARREKTMAERLANEILDASNGLGASVKRREDTHKMAEANKAFAHYRW